MTTRELIARLRELDPDGDMLVIIADDMGNYERTLISREPMVRDDSDYNEYDFPDDENDPRIVEVILL